MMKRMNKALVGFAAALCLVGLSHADASDDPLPPDQYRAARDSIEAQLKAGRKACKALKGDREDACLAQAKGKAQVARARLEATQEPTPEHEQALREAEADADYAVARAGCRQPSDKARKACVAKAQAARVAAVRLAKVEKVRALRSLERAEADTRPDSTEAEKYAAAKARCGMSGADRDRCMADARRRFNKS